MYQPLTPDELKAEHAKQPNQAGNISPKDLVSEVVNVTFTDLDSAPGTLPVISCLVTLVNGFQVVGKSFAADPVNFNRKLGEHYAYKDAMNQLYSIQAYVKKEQAYDRACSRIDE